MFMFTNRQQRAAELALNNPKPFSELKMPRGMDNVCISAKTYNPENPLEDIFPNVKPGLPREDSLIDPTGNYMYSRMILSRGEGLLLRAGYSLWDSGSHAYFDEDIIIPALHYRGRGFGWDTWMSLTPMEIWTQQSGIIAATGHVIVGGLGMGWLLRQIAKKHTVKKITVVEKEQVLLDWYGTKLCEATPKVTDVICGDIYDVAPKFLAEKAKFVLDIWPSISDAEGDKKLQALRDAGAKVWAWGCARDPRPNWRHDDPRRALR